MAPSINVFRELVLRDLESLPKKRFYDDPNIKLGIKQLRKDLIIRPADKGGGIVILDKWILSEVDTYKPSLKDPTVKCKNALITLVDRGVQLSILDKKEREFL